MSLGHLNKKQENEHSNSKLKSSLSYYEQLCFFANIIGVFSIGRMKLISYKKESMIVNYCSIICIGQGRILNLVLNPELLLGTKSTLNQVGYHLYYLFPLEYHLSK